MVQILDIDHGSEIEVKFMKPSGITYIFIDEEPSWQDLDKIIHICSTPDMDQRERYIFERKDIQAIEAKLQ